MSYRGEKFNSEGYHDPTPFEALKNIDKGRNKERNAMAKKVIKTIQNVAHLAGFDIVGKVVLKDHETGEIWR